MATDPRYNTPDVVATDCRKRLFEIDVELGEIARDLHSLYCNQGIDNRLAKDVLEQVRVLIAQVRVRLRPD